MTVLYISYHDFSDVSSGSGLRPYAMYNAFLDRNYKIVLLNERAARGDNKNRTDAVRKVCDYLKHERPDFCYIESNTGPILFNCDYSLIRLLHKMKIPTAYFYRDCYRKFPDLFSKRHGLLNSLKELYLDFLTARTDRVLKLVDIVYIPSLEGKYLFPYSDVRALPPAGTDMVNPITFKLSNTAIYVGGISSSYGFDTLLDAFSILNDSKESSFKLICICRKDEYNSFSHKDKEAPWLEVHHVSGAALEEYYRRASVAIIPKKSNEYNKMALSVKFFEYMSYGLPIVAISNASSDAIIDKYGLGYITDKGAEGIASCVKELLSDEREYMKIRQNVISSLLDGNLWVHRVDQIQKELSEYRNRDI